MRAHKHQQQPSSAAETTTAPAAPETTYANIQPSKSKQPVDNAAGDGEPVVYTEVKPKAAPANTASDETDDLYANVTNN